MAWKDEAQDGLNRIRALLEVSPPNWAGATEADASLTTLLQRSVQLFKAVGPGEPLATIDLRLVQAKDRIEALHNAVLEKDRQKAIEYIESALQLLRAAVTK